MGCGGGVPYIGVVFLNPHSGAESNIHDHMHLKWSDVVMNGPKRCTV